MGIVLGDSMGIELLPEEASRIGKAAATQLKSTKEHDKALAGNAAAKRTQARKQASKNAERAADLDARLAKIDAEHDAARSKLWRKCITHSPCRCQMAV